ncbi:kinase-like domain-containing protein [Syncephalis pseudoplumigaleata]|uniref:Kinase-like domain-containing protein n=1 Tax=Syncephalis pseudoplumigaleata TaxID=1712513 RepID=A0A4P9Z4V9_9FUNG|nr:kinase-like domain-containing protein [Syncephalis pseudoplumigaleata]|eukprot:RKP27634.1 kinase-like domain-containing protein [Syncephalis pseudoplumigaleata]
MSYRKLTLTAALKACLIATCALTASAAPTGAEIDTGYLGALPNWSMQLDVNPNIFLGHKLADLTDFRNYGVTISKALGANKAYTIEIAQGMYTTNDNKHKYDAFIKCVALASNVNGQSVPNMVMDTETKAFLALIKAGNGVADASRTSHVSKEYVSLDTLNKRCFVYSYDGSKNLLKYLNGRPLGSIHDIKSVAADTLTGLIFLHEKARLVHNDIKADNLMISAGADNRPTATIIDFDLASPLNRDGNGRVIPENRNSGTHGYVPPEVYGTALYDTLKKDIWAAGITIYEMITGFHPLYIQTTVPVQQATLNLKTTGFDWKPVQAALKQYPKAETAPLFRALQAMLSIDPQGRPTARECLNILNGQKLTINTRPPKPLPNTPSKPLPIPPTAGRQPKPLPVPPQQQQNMQPGFNGGFNPNLLPPQQQQNMQPGFNGGFNPNLLPPQQQQNSMWPPNQGMFMPQQQQQQQMPPMQQGNMWMPNQGMPQPQQQQQFRNPGGFWVPPN